MTRRLTATGDRRRNPSRTARNRASTKPAPTATRSRNSRRRKSNPMPHCAAFGELGRDHNGNNTTGRWVRSPKWTTIVHRAVARNCPWHATVSFRFHFHFISKTGNLSRCNLPGDARRYTFAGDACQSLDCWRSRLLERIQHLKKRYVVLT